MIYWCLFVIVIGFLIVFQTALEFTKEWLNMSPKNEKIKNALTAYTHRIKSHDERITETEVSLDALGDELSAEEEKINNLQDSSVFVQEKMEQNEQLLENQTEELNELQDSLMYALGVGDGNVS